MDSVSQELAGWREWGFYGQENLHGSYLGSGQEEGALADLSSPGLASADTDTPEHVVIVYKREGLSNLCQTSCTVNFTMVCLALHARRLVL